LGVDLCEIGGMRRLNKDEAKIRVKKAKKTKRAKFNKEFRPFIGRQREFALHSYLTIY
jgi:hypothetical protein